MEFTIKMRSVVTGIHITKIGGHEKIPLILENDDSIPDIDPMCILVKFPKIEDIPRRYHKLITYPKNPEHRRFEDQLVEDVAGMKVGNVPANVCCLFRNLQGDSRVERLQCVPVGVKPRPSIAPPSKTKFRKSPYAGGKDRRGGGLVLDCEYIIQLKSPSYRSAVKSEVRQFLEEHDGDETIL